MILSDSDKNLSWQINTEHKTKLKYTIVNQNSIFMQISTNILTADCHDIVNIVITCIICNFLECK